MTRLVHLHGWANILPDQITDTGIQWESLTLQEIPPTPRKKSHPTSFERFIPHFRGERVTSILLGLRETRTINRNENHLQSIFTGWHKLSGLELKETSTLWKISNFHLPSPKCPLSPISEGEGDKGQPPKNEDFYRWGSPDLSNYCHFTHTSSYRL